MNATRTVASPCRHFEVDATTGQVHEWVSRKVTIPEYDPWGPDEPDIYEVGEDDE